MSDKKKTKNPKQQQTTVAQEPIEIDKDKGLVFSSEEEALEHFKGEIEFLENEYHEFRPENDLSSEDIGSLEEHLTELLHDPDEVWLSEDVCSGIPLGAFIGYFETEDEVDFYYIALTYFVDNTPRFVFVHFATKDLTLLEKYQRGIKVYEKNNAMVTSDSSAVDALSDGDELAIGLYQAMLKLRGVTDIPESDFSDYLKYREETIEEPEEIWRKIDSEGRVLVSFIKSVEDSGDIKYIVLTIEDKLSESQYLLFSFPTKDLGLIERYRQGESMDKVSYTREESH